MQIILARHGNTFGPDDKVTWVGSANDLPLVESGLAQAKRVAEALSTTKLAGIYCAPLLRTRRFAEEVAAAQKAPPTPIIDKRLTELDYGDWSGLSDQEVIAGFGETAFRNWLDKSIWPENSHWGSNEKDVSEDILAFAYALTSAHGDDDTVLVVSSNGRLRYFLKLVKDEFERRVTEKTFKMGTGRVSLLTGPGGGINFSLSFWNEEPDALLKAFSGAASL